MLALTDAFRFAVGQARNVCAARLVSVISAHHVDTIAYSQVIAVLGKKGIFLQLFTTAYLPLFNVFFNEYGRAVVLNILLMKFLSDSHKFPNSSARKEQRHKGNVRLYILSISLAKDAEMNE